MREAGDGIAPKPTDELRFAQEVLTEHRYEYERLLEAWRDLESKAQGVATVSGVFIGVLYAFVRDFDDCTTTLEKVGVSVVLLTLVTAILASLKVLSVRTVIKPPTGGILDRWISNVLYDAPMEEVSERELLLHHDRNRMWKAANEKIAAEHDSKKKWLRFSHWTLVIAAVLLAGLTIVLMWTTR